MLYSFVKWYSDMFNLFIMCNISKITYYIVNKYNIVSKFYQKNNIVNVQYKFYNFYFVLDVYAFIYLHRSILYYYTCFFINL